MEKIMSNKPEKGRFELANEVKKKNNLRYSLTFGAIAIKSALGGCAKSELQKIITWHQDREGKTSEGRTFSNSDQQKLEDIRKKSISLNGQKSLDDYLNHAMYNNHYAFDFIGYLFPEGEKGFRNWDLVYANELSKELEISIDKKRKQDIIQNYRANILIESKKEIKKSYSNIKKSLNRNRKTITATVIAGLLSFAVSYYFHNNQLEEKIKQINHYEQIIEDRNQQDLEEYMKDSLLDNYNTQENKLQQN